jgi:serine/threonine-protein kinase
MPPVPPQRPSAEPLPADEAAALFGMAMQTVGEKPGDIIGSHTLIELIGDGGFGRVWVASQEEPVKRRVALKILKPGVDTDEVVSRFRQEWQSLAMMDHPGIARIFDAGTTPAGRPYFTMELVHGQPITTYCDSRGLSLEERLQLFIKVCLAVQHAHQKGVIHRDLKPSNILICEEDGSPSPRIIDFGVARILDQRTAERTFVTRVHQIIGTPGYMSPEQLESDGRDLDTRTDIYSLGVILYEMLTGTQPFENESLAQAAHEAILRKVREEMPTHPSRRVTALSGNRATAIARHRSLPPDRLRAALRGDLDWITLKCLEKDRQRRYDNVGSLAEDIRHHLEDLPVTARPPDRGYLLALAIRRNRLAFTLGLITLAALIAAVCASTLFFLRERNARVQSETLRREAEAARDSAARARGSAEEIITYLFRDLRTKLMPLGKLDLLESIGSTAEGYYQNLPPGERNLATELQRCEVLFLNAGVLFQRNELPKAVGLYQEGLAILERATAREPDNRLGLQLQALFISRMADALGAQGHAAESLAMRQRELELTRVLAKGEPANSEQQLNLCIALRKLAERLALEGRHAEAHTIMDECLALSGAMYPDHLPFAYRVLGDWESRDGNHQAAIATYRKALAGFEIYADRSPDNINSLRSAVHCRINLAQALFHTGQTQEGRGELRTARKITQRFSRVDPTNGDVRGDLGNIHTISGMFRLAGGEHALALVDFQEALNLYSRLARKDPSHISWHNSLLRLADETRALAAKSEPSDPARTLAAHTLLIASECRAASMNLEQARAALDEARPMIEQLSRETPDDPNTADLIIHSEALAAKLSP